MHSQTATLASFALPPVIQRSIMRDGVRHHTDSATLMKRVIGAGLLHSRSSAADGGRATNRRKCHYISSITIVKKRANRALFPDKTGYSASAIVWALLLGLFVLKYPLAEPPRYHPSRIKCRPLGDNQTPIRGSLNKSLNLALHRRSPVPNEISRTKSVLALSYPIW